MSPFILVPTTEAMVPELCDLYLAAFESNSANRAMLPDTGRAVRERLYERDRATARREPKNADEHDFAVIDTSTASPDTTRFPQGAPVGRGTWKLEHEGAASWRHPVDAMVVEGANVEAMHAFFGFIDDMRLSQHHAHARADGPENTMMWHLTFLAVHPAHQGRGVGRFLVDWGLQRADDMHLPAYLDSTPAGRPMYERLGFKVIDRGTIDLRPYGVEDAYTNYSMLRQPREKV